jgi:hypothetical protein
MTVTVRRDCTRYFGSRYPKGESGTEVAIEVAPMRIDSLVLGLMLAGTAFGANPDADWHRLSLLDRSQIIQVHVWNGRVRVGTIVEVDADGLTFSEGPAASLVKREDIKAITRKSRGKGALLGALVGFGIGAPVGGVAVNIADRKPTSGDHLTGGALLGGFLGAIGAGIGAAVGAQRTIYKADPVKRPPKVSPASPAVKRLISLMYSEGPVVHGCYAG